MTKTIQLKVENILESECNDGVSVEHEVASIIHLLGHVPRVGAQTTRGSAVQMEADDLRVVKAWDATKPRYEVGATRDFSGERLCFIHVFSEGDAGRPVKYAGSRWARFRIRCFAPPRNDG